MLLKTWLCFIIFVYFFKGSVNFISEAKHEDIEKLNQQLKWNKLKQHDF